MKTLRRRWRLVLGLMIVVAAITIGFVSSSVPLQAGSALLAFFAVIVLIISSGRKGGGRINPWHTNSGSGSGGLM